MNSQRRGGSSSSSPNTFDFDLGIGSNRSSSLNDHKLQPKPSWTHQPLPTHATRPGLPNGPTSMVGDISGKSWSSSTPSGAGIGVVDKNPNLFGDLLGSALGQGRGNSNVPLKNVTPQSSTSTPIKGAYSMGNLADSLPKSSNSVKNGGNWGSDNFGTYSSSYNNSSNSINVNKNSNANLGGAPIKSMGGGGGGLNSNKDPFGSLVDFRVKPTSNVNVANKGNSKSSNSGDFSFGEFQNAPKSSVSSNVKPMYNNVSMGSNQVSDSTFDDFAIPTKNFTSQNQPSVQSTSVDPLDMLFSTTSAAAGAASAAGDGLGSQQFSEVDDWGLDSGFGGGSDVSGGGTTELEGLPPPPAGVTASLAKNKGIEYHKQGQHADAIKWLSWAFVLFEKSGGFDASVEVLSCRASCYKEVGEHKKAVADCTKVLDHDGENVAVLVQRALLYESIEKYRLGAEDLRTVLKIDPGNRVARSTVHRLAKMAD